MAERPDDALKIATIYSYGQNEEDPDGFIDDENGDSTEGLERFIPAPFREIKED